jgi:hypothetical protein
VLTEEGGSEPVESEIDFSISVQLPDNPFGSTMRVAKEATWEHFKAVVDHLAGRREWCAGFEDKPWNSHESTPSAGSSVEVRWVSTAGKPSSKANFVHPRPKPTDQTAGQPRQESVPKQESVSAGKTKQELEKAEAAKAARAAWTARKLKGGNGAPGVDT